MAVDASVLPERFAKRLMGEILTAKDVAGILKMNERTVIYHFQRRNLPAKKIGCQWRCRREDLEKFMSS